MRGGVARAVEEGVPAGAEGLGAAPEPEGTVVGVLATTDELAETAGEDVGRALEVADTVVVGGAEADATGDGPAGEALGAGVVTTEAICSGGSRTTA